jgi:hypothetical protein
MTALRKFEVAIASLKEGLGGMIWLPARVKRAEPDIGRLHRRSGRSGRSGTHTDRSRSRFVSPYLIAWPRARQEATKGRSNKSATVLNHQNSFTPHSADGSVIQTCTPVNSHSSHPLSHPGKIWALLKEFGRLYVMPAKCTSQWIRECQNPEKI